MIDRLRQVPRRLLVVTALLCGGYLATAHRTFGVRPEHIGAVALIFGGLLWNEATRNVVRGLYPFFLAGIFYDTSRLLQPILKYLTVHVREPYAFDKTLFGIETSAGSITPNEYLVDRHWPWLDFITGWAYILYMYVPLALAIYLLIRHRNPEGRRLLYRFGWAFFALNMLGVITYYLYPAAPPWYVARYGFGPVDLATPPSPAAALRWDALMGVNYFKNFYARGASVFGAIPSLHGALPLITFLYLRQLRKPVASALCFGFFLLVCFSAVYLQHHYILDLAVGSTFVLLCYWGELAVSRRLLGGGFGGGRPGAAARVSGASEAAADGVVAPASP